MKKTKADPIPMKFQKPLERYLRKQAKKQGKTMVRIVEELLEFHRQSKGVIPKAA